MSIKRTASLMLITPLTAILVVSTGCKLYRAEKAFDEGKYVESARAYSQVVQQNPNNVKARIGYKRSAALAADIYVLNALEAERKAETASANKNEAERDMQLEIAETEIRRALAFAPQNTVALDLLARVLARTEDIRLLNESMKSSSNDDLAAMRDRIENEPMIKLATKEPFIKTFRIPGRPLKDAFDMLSKHFGILFNYHTSFTQATDSPITLHVEDMPLERILDVLALQNELYYRYIDAKTVMVFKGGANATSRGENENQQYKNIYLDNSKPQEVVQTLQRLLGGQAQQRIIIAQDNRLNALIVKGRPSDIALVTWLARGIDKAKAEVMIYVELLEVTETSMEQVGLLPVADTMGTVAYRMGATIDLSGTFNINRGGVRISKEDIRYLFPSLQLDALKTSGEAKMAASQNMRISNDTGAIFNFGEKMFMQQSQALGTTGQQQTQYGYPPANNYQQQDVGIKVNITPRIHHNNEITLDIDADVTNLKPNSANIERPDLGQRKLKTEVRAQNGETIIFGGLRREDESKSKQGVWGRSDIRILGKLLGSNTENLTKTDVLLTVRAVIVRKPELRPEDFRP
jgi:general secretion pathway protein D